MEGPEPSEFAKERHAAFAEMMLHELPRDYASQEINRVTLAYFAVSSLSLLRSLHRVDKDQIATWVLSFQAKPKETHNVDDGKFFGFCGSRSCQFSEGPGQSVSNLASTYSALAILKVIGYDFQNFDSSILLESMRSLQMPDGSFMPIDSGAETDLRFVYCAAAISSMLNDWSGMDREKAKDYIIKCQSYDGGFGLIPGSESHGGATYCAVAALFLMGFIQNDCNNSLSFPTSTIDIPSLVEWCIQRQGADGGFQGRANKDSDTCYAFWVGSVLKMLGLYHLVNKSALRTFLFTCQSPYGGFTKFPYEVLPDLYHSYYGFAALSLLEEKELGNLSVELGLAALN
ncbi:Geranylgeranyl transferase type-1 subunit beta [Rhynchospora pubera]|uniref:Geranylgeranyl transferase type-1 subunit beta n=1 Tax=Rhynchospora pubera TaxID=906938 RepID=A0AAV8GUY3_9POAL|nr:Geranylgeranyl transferase type-1 subunit beta [Rhynchospora pubera]